MKRILQNSFGKTILCLLVALVSLPAWANNTNSNTCFSAVRANVAIGSGKVYVSKTNQAPASGAYESPSHYDYQTGDRHFDWGWVYPEHTYYLFAQANQGYYFDGWYTNNNCTEGRSTNIPLQVKLTAESRDKENPTSTERYAKFVAFDPVTFSVPAGTYAEPQNVTLSCTTSGATIKYSFDNSTWNTYSTPIPVTENTTIYARAEKIVSGLTCTSNDYSATYTLLLTLTNDGDNTSNIASFNGKTCDVKLDGRTLSKNDAWNSLCLPFDLTIEGSILDGDGVIAKELDNASFSANTLTLNFKEVTTLEAGKPYIIKWANAGALVSPVFENVTIKSGEPTAVRIPITNLDGSGEMYITFEGTYEKLANFDDPRHILYVGSNNNLNYPGPNSWIGAQRAYFKLEGVHAGSGSGANFIKESVIGINDEDPTGIDNVNDNDNDNLNLNDEPIYNIAGQRISKMQKGINIVNGKKIFVK